MIKYDYIFHELAQKEYEDALRWYAIQSKKAAENFVIAVENTLSLICDNPKRWHRTFNNFHELGLKKYPYTIVYTFDVEAQIVVIASIYHQKRNPTKKFIPLID